MRLRICRGIACLLIPFLAAIAQLEGFHLVQQEAEKIVVNALLKYESARCRATLPRGAECAPQRALEGKIEICIVHHDLRVLSTHLEGKTLMHPPACLSNDAASLGRTGE